MISTKTLIPIGLIIGGTVLLILLLITLVKPYDTSRFRDFAFLSGIDPLVGLCYQARDILRVTNTQQLTEFMESGAIQTPLDAEKVCANTPFPSVEYSQSELIGIPVAGILAQSAEAVRLATTSSSKKTGVLGITLPIIPSTCDGVGSSTVWVSTPTTYDESMQVAPYIVEQPCAEVPAAIPVNSEAMATGTASTPQVPATAPLQFEIQ